MVLIYSLFPIVYSLLVIAYFLLPTACCLSDTNLAWPPRARAATSARTCRCKGTSGRHAQAHMNLAAQMRKNTRNPDLRPISIFYVCPIFIKIGLMCWIWIDFALLNAFANCDFYLFFEILTFLGYMYICIYVCMYICAIS